MKSVRLALFFGAIILFNTNIMAQEILEASETEETLEMQEADDEQNQEKKKLRIFFTAGLLGILNTHSGTESATSPILFMPGFGINYNLFNNISLQPRLNFFYNYYLWNKDMALPAEVENRTATVFSALLDIPVLLRISTRHEKFSLQAGGGIAILARYGILSSGVKEDDPNRDYPNRSASDDVEDINSYMWENMRWIYPELSANIMFGLNNGWLLGASGTLYLPLGSTLSGEILNETMLNICVKLMY